MKLANLKIWRFEELKLVWFELIVGAVFLYGWFRLEKKSKKKKNSEIENWKKKENSNLESSVLESFCFWKVWIWKVLIFGKFQFWKVSILGSFKFGKCSVLESSYFGKWIAYYLLLGLIEIHHLLCSIYRSLCAVELLFWLGIGKLKVESERDLDLWETGSLSSGGHNFVVLTPIWENFIPFRSSFRDLQRF